ncbi:MAG TPA: DUF2142 domain-containing protein, partial [Candidatus Merdenecus merdavium]|nr:DUF2142 domain-containing protein [Candidatus Merdenecus merdavium]
YQSEFYIKTFVGESLSYLNISVPSIFTYFFLVLLGVSTIREEKEEQLITIPHKLYILMMSLGSIFLVLFSMLYFWTPMSYTTIEGVQGRYFIPIAFLLLLLCRNSTVVSKKSLIKPIMFSMSFLQMLYMMCLIFSIA